MWTQRDQLSAYQFLRRRSVSALQTGDANHPVSPSRRVVLTGALGVTAALLIAAGFGVYGVLKPGASNDWREPGRVVIEKETGATYVLGADGLLHPVANYASARLLAGGDGSATATVSARSLSGVARGVPLGIAGAPQSLPARNRLVAGPWTVCAATTDGRPSSTVTTTATVGVAGTGAAVPGQQALIVRDPANVRYAIVDGRRLRIRDAATSAALGYDGAATAPVTAAWLSAIPAGPDLALVTTADSGKQGPRIGGQATLIGQVLVAQSVGSEDRYYVVRANNLEAITQTEAALILGNPATRTAYPNGRPNAVAVSAADMAGVARTDRPKTNYPAKVPQPAAIPADRSVVCAVSDGGEQVSVRLTEVVPLPAAGQTVAVRADGRDARAADEVFVPPSSGALVRERQSPGAETGTVYLLTDQGIRYPIANGDAVKALGYGAVGATPVAATLLALFPIGPALDIAAAQRPAT
jgi:type VII secretion protein EccB